MLHCDAENLRQELGKTPQFSKPISPSKSAVEYFPNTNALDLLADAALSSEIEKNKKVYGSFEMTKPSYPQLLARDSSATLLPFVDTETITSSSSDFFSTPSIQPTGIEKWHSVSMTDLAISEDEQGNEKNHHPPTRQFSESTLSNVSLETFESANSRQGISRFAAYGFRFMARMKDGSIKTSHLAGDLADRAKEGRNRVDLTLIPHSGEMAQLESAWNFYERSLARGNLKPTPSDILNHLKQQGMDQDFRKDGENAKLLQRNASNFFKRMMEYGTKQADATQREAALILCMQFARNCGEFDMDVLSQTQFCAASENEDELFENNRTGPGSTIARIRQNRATYKTSERSSSVTPSKKRLHAVLDFSDDEFTDGGVSDDYGTESDVVLDDDDSDEDFGAKICRKKRKTGKVIASPTSIPSTSDSSASTSLSIAQSGRQASSARSRNKPIKPASSSCSLSDKVSASCNDQNAGVRTSSNMKPSSVGSQQKQQKPHPIMTRPPSCAEIIGTTSSTANKSIKLIGAKGLSRHSPYGTRFSAEMEDGTIRQSFLAGDLTDRVRVKGSRARGELRLILHKGEVEQLECAWAFVVQTEQERGTMPGAAMVLDHLRRMGLDLNHRKNGGHLLQKNAGNFFKRVQEFGRRRALDPNYLKVDPTDSPENEITFDNAEPADPIPTQAVSCEETSVKTVTDALNPIRLHIPAAFPDPASISSPNSQPVVTIEIPSKKLILSPQMSSPPAPTN